MASDLLQYLVVGSYLFGAGSWLFLYREVRAVHESLDALTVTVARMQGTEEGLDLDQRVTRLEQHLLHHDL